MILSIYFHYSFIPFDPLPTHQTPARYYFKVWLAEISEIRDQATNALKEIQRDDKKLHINLAIEQKEVNHEEYMLLRDTYTLPLICTLL